MRIVVGIALAVVLAIVFPLQWAHIVTWAHSLWDSVTR